MKILTSPLIIIAFCTATTVAGCGGGGGIDTASSTLITKTVNGRVADGYIQGATIFWDCNNNMKPDIDEISTKSSTGGEYIIAQAPTPKVPGTQCTLRAYIPATAVDESTGLAVGATYTMSSVDGHPEFISPLTTVLNLGGYTEEELRSKFPATASLAFTSDYIAAGDAGSQHHNASKVLAISLQSISGLVATDDTQARREVLSRALALVPIDSYKSLNATNAFLAAFKSNTPNLDQQTNLLSITLDKAEFQLVESAFNGSQDSRRAYIDLSLAAIKAHPEAILGNSVNWNLVPYNERSAWSTAIQGGSNGFSDSEEVVKLIQQLLAERERASAEIENARRIAEDKMLIALAKGTASMGFTTLDSIAKLTNVSKIAVAFDLNKYSRLKATIETFKKGFAENERLWATLSGCTDFAAALTPGLVEDISSGAKLYEIGLAGSKCTAALIQSDKWSALLSAWSAGTQIGGSEGEMVVFAKGLSDMVAAIIDSSGIGWASAVYNESFGMYFSSMYYAYQQGLVGKEAVDYFDSVSNDTLTRFGNLSKSYSSAIINARISRYIKPKVKSGISINIPESAIVGESILASIDQRVAQPLGYKIYWGVYPDGTLVTSRPSEWSSSGGRITLAPVRYNLPGKYTLEVGVYDTSLGGTISPFQIISKEINVSCPVGTTVDAEGTCITSTQGNFSDDFSDPALDAKKWVVESIGGNLATLTWKGSYLDINVPGGSCGYCGISDGVRFRPQTDPLTGDFVMELSAEEIARASRDGTPPINNIQLLLFGATAQAGIYVTGDVNNNQGNPGHTIYAFYSNGGAATYPIVKSLTIGQYYAFKFRIRRAGGVLYLGYMIPQDSAWNEVTVPSSFPSATVVTPSIVVASGDGGGTRVNSSFKARFRNFSISR